MIRIKKIAPLLFIIMVLSLACSLTQVSNNAAEVKPTEEMPTLLPPPTEEPTEVPPTEAPTAKPIVHTSKPEFSTSGDPQVIHDQESDRLAEEKQAYGGDEFVFGRYERPFDQDMNYMPIIDIKQANLFREEEDEFVYATIRLMEDPAMHADQVYYYGIELDIDVDGRGDILILTRTPSSDQWAVEGVTVWKDLNEDIGSNTPMQNDPPPGGNGYEVIIFDEGDSYDPDLAWSRISVEDPTFIDIAFKRDLLEENEMFLWGSWAFLGEEQYNPFDHHDHYTYEQAGSPMKSEQDYYPLKDLYALDNTCRAASGFKPLGSEPGLCPIPPEPEGEPEPGPGCRLVCTGGIAARICTLVCE